MRAIDYLQINMIPFAVLLMMRMNAHRTLSYTWRNRALRFIMVLVAAILMVDMLAWMLNGKQFPGASALIWIFNLIYFALMEFTAYLWFLYVKDIVTGENGQRGRIVLLPSIPLALFLLLLVTTPWNHLLFYVDENNCYVRGKLFLVHTVLAVGYMLAASALALFHCKNAVGRETKKQYRLLAAFVVLPLVSGLVQVFCYGTALLWPFTSAALVMVYIDVQREQVTRDGLTGLNNRRRLHRYLESLEPWREEKEGWYLLLMDVNRFKKINDTYGHVMGDTVLKLVSAQLKKIFGDTRAFLARYGGDEFVVIMKSKSEQEIEARMEDIKNALARIDWGDDDAWKIEVSIGCAKYDRTKMSGTDEWFVLADERMYQEKRAGKMLKNC